MIKKNIDIHDSPVKKTNREIKEEFLKGFKELGEKSRGVNAFDGEPTDDQKEFYIAENPEDIEQKQKWNYDGGNENAEVSKEGKKTNVQVKKLIRIKKYSQNGNGPLHESVVIGEISKFATLDKSNRRPKFVDKIERINDILLPSDTIDTQNPIPFTFESKEQLEKCLEEARKETLDSLFMKIESINRKYVDVEDHYHALVTADIIWTWFQDKFGYTHYNIFVGDNGSGKNSQLLVFKYLAYRVFYVVSASAPNYYTKMGKIEEGQITIAEDEAEDIAFDREKRNVFKTGYCSGASVPKVELEGGRKSDDWLTYCQKWVAMEELPNDKEMRGILDRSFVFRFVSGDPEYNIKDVIRTAGDPQFKPLYYELIKTRKILFCWRLLHYDDEILDIQLNLKNRSAELTKGLIRLFANSPLALERILGSLDKFMAERNEIKKNSFESKLFDVICQLKEERTERSDMKKETEEDKALAEYDIAFTNRSLLEKSKELMEGKDTDKEGVFYSSEIGKISSRRITSISKSKFKANPFPKKIADKTVRCIEYQEKYLDRIKSSYHIPDKIEIMKSKEEKVTLVTEVTLARNSLLLYTDIMNTKITSISQILFQNSNKNN